MALIYKDRVKETCSAPGTGTITLLGPVAGFAGFSRVGNGNTTYYAIVDQAGINWEVGIGTWATGGSYGTLTRNTVYANSLNTTAKIDFASGTQDVFLTLPSQFAVQGSTSSAGTSLGTSAAAGALGTALGTSATTGNFGTALGSSAVATGSYSVALGGSSTTPTGGTGSIALGYSSDALGTLAISVGYNSSANPSSIALGAYTNILSDSSVGIGRSISVPSGLTSPAVVISADPAGFTAPNEGVFVNNVRDETSGAPDTVIKYDSVTKELFYGTGGGGGASPATPTAYGTVYGSTTNGSAAVGSQFKALLGYQSSGTDDYSTSLGYSATSNQYAVAVGSTSNASATNSIAIGRSAASPGLTSVAVGRETGAQGDYSVAIGTNAITGNGTGSGIYSVAIGANANATQDNTIVISGQNGIFPANSGVFIDSFRDESTGSPDKVLKYNTTTKELFYGAQPSAPSATPTTEGIVYGSTTNISAAVGSQFQTLLGYQSSGTDDYSTSLGYSAIGNQYSVAVGSTSNASATNSIAIGRSAASAGLTSVAVGRESASRGDYSVAVGTNAITGNGSGSGIYSVAIGANANATQDNTIVITAKNGLTPSSSGVFIDSFRDVTTADATYTIKYNESQNELAYDPINLQLNPSTISQDITIPAGFNGSLIGPITVDDGYSITVNDGATFVVVT